MMLLICLFAPSPKKKTTSSIYTTPLHHPRARPAPPLGPSRARPRPRAMPHKTTAIRYQKLYQYTNTHKPTPPQSAYLARSAAPFLTPTAAMSPSGCGLFRGGTSRGGGCSCSCLSCLIIYLSIYFLDLLIVEWNGGSVVVGDRHRSRSASQPTPSSALSLHYTFP